jgi:hypothetical protein
VPHLDLLAGDLGMSPPRSLDPSRSRVRITGSAMVSATTSANSCSLEPK